MWQQLVSQWELGDSGGGVRDGEIASLGSPLWTFTGLRGEQ